MRCVLKYLSVVCLLVVAGVHTAFAQYDKDAFFMRGRRALADGKYAQAIDRESAYEKLLTKIDENPNIESITRSMIYDGIIPTELKI